MIHRVFSVAKDSTGVEEVLGLLAKLQTLRQLNETRGRRLFVFYTMGKPGKEVDLSTVILQAVVLFRCAPTSEQEEWEVCRDLGNSLALAITWGRLDVAKPVLERLASLGAAATQPLARALQHALRLRRIGFVKMLLRSPRVDISLVDMCSLCERRGVRTRAGSTKVDRSPRDDPLACCMLSEFRARPCKPDAYAPESAFLTNSRLLHDGLEGAFRSFGRQRQAKNAVQGAVVKAHMHIPRFRKAGGGRNRVAEDPQGEISFSTSQLYAMALAPLFESVHPLVADVVELDDVDISDLFLWATFLGNMELIKCFWELCDDPLHIALTGAYVSRHVAETIDSVLSTGFITQAETLETWAIGVLDCMPSLDVARLALLRRMGQK
eukprot:2811218-Prymnesium_polylepis.1